MKTSSSGINKLCSNNILFVIWGGTDFKRIIFPIDLITVLQKLHGGKAWGGRIWCEQKGSSRVYLDWFARTIPKELQRILTQTIFTIWEKNNCNFFFFF